MLDPSFIVILLLGVGLLWLMSSRTRKQQREAARFRDNLEPGQEVMTGSGLFATVVEVEGDRVVLEIAPGVTSQWLKPAIAKLVEPPMDDDEEYSDEDDGEYDDEDFEDDEEYDDADDGDEEWDDVEVPDDASSLTSDDASSPTPDEDDESKR
jgi:preprotein translocase subunit YajC